VRNRAAIFPQQHEGRAKHGFFSVMRRRAITKFVTHANRCHIADTNRDAISSCDDDVANIVKISNLPGERM
jgi:hypothetical protein